MSRTARCLLALGFSVTLAAACGDDDGVINGVGGGAGAAGASGSAGAAGRGGGAGTAGTAGRGGSAGSTAGRGGSAGTGAGGTSAGTAGTEAGTGGTETGEIPDGGVDASAGAAGDDAGTVTVPDAAAPDAGANGDCPATLETTQSDAIAAANSQEIAIARVFFLTNGGATVVLKNVSNAPFIFGDTSFLCSGGLNTCVPTSGLPALAAGAEQTIGFIDDTAPDGGELALLSFGGTAVFAYVAWDDGVTDYVSQDVTADFDNDGNTADTTTSDDLEQLAITAGNGGAARWTQDERVTVVAPQNTIFGDDGDTTGLDGFSVCTGDGDHAGQ